MKDPRSSILDKPLNGHREIIGIGRGADLIVHDFQSAYGGCLFQDRLHEIFPPGAIKPGGPDNEVIRTLLPYRLLPQKLA